MSSLSAGHNRQWKGLRAVPHLRDQVHGHVKTLLSTISDEDLEKLAEHLRVLALEGRGGGATRPHWETTVVKAARPVLGRPLRGRPGEPGAASGSGLRLDDRQYDGLGRVLVAERVFQPGDPLFTEKPIVVIPNCLPGVGGERGPIMTELAEARPGLDAVLDMDRVVEFFCTLEPSVIEDLKSLKLESHQGIRDFMAAVVADEVAEIAAHKRIIAQSQVQELAWFLRVVAINACTAPRVKGVALFMWISMISHSCAPNTQYSSDEVGLQDAVTPRAAKRISSEDLISVSYIPLQLMMASTSVRQDMLKAQHGFLCMCERCLDTDTARIMPCPYCPKGGCKYAKPSPEEDPRWQCGTCGEEVDPSKLPLAKEERILRFMRSFQADEEQMLHTLLVVVEEDLGKKGVSTDHFLRAWIMLHLLQHLLHQLPSTLVGHHAGSEDANEDLTVQGRVAVRAMVVLWRLCEWVRQFAPACWDSVAVQCGVPVIRALLAVERTIEAQSIAAMFESSLAACLGPHSWEVRNIGRLLLGMDRPPQGMLVVTCDRCGNSLMDVTRDASVCPVAEIAAEKTEAAAGTDSDQHSKSLPPVQWCRRCYLAPYCNSSCQMRGRKKHDPLCITAAGPAWRDESVPPTPVPSSELKLNPARTAFPLPISAANRGSILSVPILDVIEDTEGILSPRASIASPFMQKARVKNRSSDVASLVHRLVVAQRSKEDLGGSADSPGGRSPTAAAASRSPGRSPTAASAD